MCFSLSGIQDCQLQVFLAGLFVLCRSVSLFRVTLHAYPLKSCSLINKTRVCFHVQFDLFILCRLSCPSEIRSGTISQEQPARLLTSTDGILTNDDVWNEWWVPQKGRNPWTHLLAVRRTQCQTLQVKHFSQVGKYQTDSVILEAWIWL